MVGARASVCHEESGAAGEEGDVAEERMLPAGERAPPSRGRVVRGTMAEAPAAKGRAPSQGEGRRRLEGGHRG